MKHICCVRRVCIREQGRLISGRLISRFINLNLIFYYDRLREVAAGHGHFTDKPAAFKTRTGINLLLGPYTSLSALAHLPNLVGDGSARHLLRAHWWADQLQYCSVINYMGNV